MMKDGDGLPIGLCGFQVVDGAGSPVTSPVGSAGTDVTLTAPALAAWLLVKGETNGLRLKDGSGNYYSINSGQDFGIPCKPGDTITLGRPVATAVSFAFQLLSQ